MAVSLDGVSKRFGGVDAIAHSSFAVREGEFFALLGPSGCGKTTTLRLIAGFEEPDAGRVLIDGRDQRGVPPYRRRVNTVFQHYALFPHMTVFDNVAFGLRSRRAREQTVRVLVEGMLELVRLGDAARRKPAQLSGGEQQRVALARALVNRPRALLLDEPLGALDLKLREAMQLELTRIQRSLAIAFVHVTHDQQEALRLADRIAVMNAGRIEQIGTPEEVYRRPATRFVATFIGTANLLSGTLVATGERATVRLDAGPEVHALGGAPRAGDRVLLVIRPEDVVVSADGAPLARPPGASRLPLRGRVTERIFEGASVRLVVTCAGGVEVQARVESRARAGEEVAVTWDPAHAYLLPE